MNAGSHTLESAAPGSVDSFYAKRLTGVWRLVIYIDEQSGRADIHPLGSGGCASSS